MDPSNYDVMPQPIPSNVYVNHCVPTSNPSLKYCAKCVWNYFTSSMSLVGSGLYSIFCCRRNGCYVKGIDGEQHFVEAQKYNKNSGSTYHYSKPERVCDEDKE